MRGYYAFPGATSLVVLLLLSTLAAGSWLRHERRPEPWHVLRRRRGAGTANATHQKMAIRSTALKQLALMPSSDFSWTALTSYAAFGDRSTHCSVAFQNQLFVIAGKNSTSYPLNDVWSSPDGIQWTLVTPSAGFSPRFSPGCVIFGSNVVVVGGTISTYNGLSDVWTTTTGAGWTVLDPGGRMSNGLTARYGHCTAVFLGRVWVIAGHWSDVSLNDVW
eukprot:RCo048046